MIDTISPRGMASETASRAVTLRLPSNCLVTRSSSIAVALGMRRMCLRSNRAPSNASGAAEADRDRAIVGQNHGHRTAALAQAEHPLARGRVLLDVEVLERDVPPIKVFTGGLCVGSRVFPEDDRHLSIVPVTHLSPTCHPPVTVGSRFRHQILERSVRNLRSMSAKSLYRRVPTAHGSCSSRDAVCVAPDSTCLI